MATTYYCSSSYKSMFSKYVSYQHTKSTFLDFITFRTNIFKTYAPLLSLITYIKEMNNVPLSQITQDLPLLYQHTYDIQKLLNAVKPCNTQGHQVVTTPRLRLYPLPSHLSTQAAHTPLSRERQPTWSQGRGRLV